MESLPDDVWHQILQKGIQAGRLDHVDLCSLAIVNSHFDQLTQGPALWATLLYRDFPLSFYSFEAPSKALYRRKHRIRMFFEYSERQFIHDVSALANSLTMLANSIQQLNLSDVTSGEDQSVLPLHEERDPVMPNASQPNLKQARKHYYENKPSKRFDKSSRPKVIPNSKSYIPMNKPPRRSMPRKI